MSVIDMMVAPGSQGTARPGPLADRTARALKEISGRVAGRSPSAGVHAYEVLREAILSGVFMLHEPLRQEAVAAAMGMSRVPVRSALFQLEQEGLLEFGERGAYVRTHSSHQVRELYQIRAVLEGHAMRLAMRAMTPEWARRLRRISDECDALSTDVVDARAEFYRELFDARNNPELVQVLEFMRTKVARYIYGWRRDHDHRAAHHRLLDAIDAKDEQLAVRLLLEGLAEVRNDILTAIELAHPKLGWVRPRAGFATR